MKKLTRKELKNVMGGTDPLPAGCCCFNFDPGLPGGGIDIDCSYGPSAQYCPNNDVMVCC
jgi:bacteriocin-like protein